MFIVMLRTMILYFIVVFTMRIMGKRQIGQLQPFELVIAIMVSELASMPMQDTRIPLSHGIIPIFTLLLLQALISVAELKSEFARIAFSGKPSIIISQGKIDIKQLKINRYNINDLLEELRLQGYYNMEDIEFAILETSGQLSIIPKTELEPVTKQDLNIKSSQDTLPITLILDGKINLNNLKVINKDKSWLLSQLKKNNILSPDKVFIALLDSKGNFTFQLKEGGAINK
ncbi:YetF domain-containing protein [Candidatus Clostridium stratigraminis]|uniref:YetF domain-containing protein n=1 Tax=Candidatus Clostridium stratigraminis TaxID=3381661 RepID=A0ABW8T2B3_9CLOT